MGELMRLFTSHKAVRAWGPGVSEELKDMKLCIRFDTNLISVVENGHIKQIQCVHDNAQETRGVILEKNMRRNDRGNSRGNV